MRIDEHPVALQELRNAGTGLDDLAGKFVSLDYPETGRVRRRHLQDMEIGTADADSLHLEQNIGRFGYLRLKPFFKDKSSFSFEYCR
jgi:hypothetical protein